MDVLVLQKRLRSAQISRLVFAGLSLLMLTMNVALTVKLFNTSNQVVLVPTSVTDGMVARGAVDVRFVEALALDATYALYNASANNLSYGRSVIERLASTGNRHKLLKRFDEVADDIRGRDISTVFKTRAIEHNRDELSLTVKGYLTTYLNNQYVTTEERWIHLQFVVEAGSARLAAISRREVQN